MNNKQKAIIIRGSGVILFIAWGFFVHKEMDWAQAIVLAILLFVGFLLVFPISDNIYDTKDKSLNKRSKR